MSVLKATKRDGRGSHKAQHMRKAGNIPGIIYGHKIDPVAVTMDQLEVEHAVTHGERLLEIQMEGHTENVLVKDVQYDAFGSKILHIDMARVNLDEVVEITVPVILRGQPVGATEGGVLTQLQADVTIQVQVRHMPDDIKVSIVDMKVGDHLLAKDLPLPAGAKLLADDDMIIATVATVAEEVEAAPAEEAATPEVLTERKPAEGEEEKKG